MKNGQVVKYRDASGVTQDATVSCVGESGAFGKILDLSVDGKKVAGVSHAKDSSGACWWLVNEVAPEAVAAGPSPSRRPSAA